MKIDGATLLTAARMSYRVSPQLQLSLNTETGELLTDWVYLPHLRNYEPPIKFVGMINKAMTEEQILEMVENI